MSAEDIVSRREREGADPAEQPPTFQMPLELASPYQMRVIETSDGSERRVGIFLPKDQNTPSIEICGNGDRIVARNEGPETIAALVKIAQHNRWEGVDVEGSSEFRKAVWLAASREGLIVQGYQPTPGEQAKLAELHGVQLAHGERGATETPAVQDLSAAAESTAVRPDQMVADAMRAPERSPATDPQIVLEERQYDAAAHRRPESENLAELFLHGSTERILAEPRLAKASEAQETMEKHLALDFDGDASGLTAATLESRQMISDVLMRGLDVSVRELTPERQIDSPQRTLDLER